MNRATWALCVVAMAGCGGEDVGVRESALGSPGLVISQVYGGGGNGSAALTFDYVELFNRGAATVDVKGMSLQYASKAGNSWSVQALATSPTPVLPGQYFLAQLASSGAVGSALPVSADLVGSSTGVNLGSTDGKVALVASTTALTCGTTVKCSSVASVVDLIGYGAATDFEGAAATAISTNVAAVRLGSGCVDSDNNKADFANATWATGPVGPALHHLGSALHVCADSDGGVEGDGGFGSDGGVVVGLPDLSGSVRDLSAPDLSVLAPDLSGVDLFGVPVIDLGVARDLSVASDLSRAPDLAQSGDGGAISGAGLVVISQIYGAGGNSGAAYVADYIELFNRSAATVAVGGWSVQYGGGTNPFAIKADIPAGTMMGPGRYLLVKLQSGSTGAALPASDVTASSLNISAASGKVALVTNGTQLTCGAAGNLCTTAAITDLVGYGTTTEFEGLAATAPATAAAALFRRAGGCIDSDVNFDDFESDPAQPRNSASPANDCSLVPLDAGVRSDLAVVLDLSTGPTGDLRAPAEDLAQARDFGSRDSGLPDLSQPQVDLATATVPPDLGGSGRATKGGCSCGVAGETSVPDLGAPMVLGLAALAFAVRRRRLQA